MKKRHRIRSRLAPSAAEAADPLSRATTPPAAEEEEEEEEEEEQEFNGDSTSANRKKLRKCSNRFFFVRVGNRGEGACLCSEFPDSANAPLTSPNVPLTSP